MTSRIRPVALVCQDALQVDFLQGTALQHEVSLPLVVVATARAGHEHVAAQTHLDCQCVRGDHAVGEVPAMSVHAGCVLTPKLLHACQGRAADQGGHLVNACPVHILT